MTTLALTHASVLRRSRWWGWPFLFAMLAGVACKPRKEVCETEKLYRVLEPPPDAGMPFSIDPLGPELTGWVVIDKPTSIVFEHGSRARLHWFRDSFSTFGPIVYSEEEGLARDPEGEGPVYPMKRLKEGSSERIHFGFRSFSCVGKKYVHRCPEKEIYLVADMACTWQRLDD